MWSAGWVGWCRRARSKLFKTTPEAEKLVGGRKKKGGRGGAYALSRTGDNKEVGESYSASRKRPSEKIVPARK